LAALEHTIRTAIAEHKSGNLAEAERLYVTALALDSHNFTALHMLGVIALQTGRPGEADGLIARARAIDPASSLACVNHGNALQQLKRHSEAVSCYDRAIELDPDLPEAFSNRGNALRAMGRVEEALHSFQRSVVLRPHYARGWSNRGLALMDLRRPDEALESFERAIACDPQLAEAHSNRGMALYTLRRFAEALTSFDRALALHPEYPEALSNRGSCLKELERFPEALASFTDALRLDPDHFDARYNRGLTLLLLGALPEGWRDYEWRPSGPHRHVGYPALPAPIWSGESLAGKRVLVLSEQGMGDTIQFARYLPPLRSIAREVFFYAYARSSMLRLLRSLPGISMGSEMPKDSMFDLAIPLLSLPLAFGTTLGTIPRAAPYLAPESDRVERWRARIGPHGFRVGVCWQGNANSPADSGRSFRAHQMLPFASIPGVRLISLQQEHGLDQLRSLPPGLKIETLDDAEQDGHAFADTAAIMQSLDLVVTSDTAIAHLAGATGRPVWIALKRVHHWVWLLDRPETPWYPTMRLFCQSTDGAWEELMQRMANELCQLVGGEQTGRATPRPGHRSA